MIKPRVSIIIPCYGMAAFVAKALESVGQQTFREWEIIGVEDGLDDGTRFHFEAFAEAHPENRVEYIVFSKNRGVSEARNEALRTSRGEYAAMLDPDDYWPVEESLQTRMKLCGPNILVGASASFVDVDGNPTGKVNDFFEWSRKRTLEESLFYSNFLVTSSVIVPTAAALEIGGFRELKWVEDWDLWLRLVESGLEIDFIEDPRWVAYRQHSGGNTTKLARWADGLRQFAELRKDRPEIGIGALHLVSLFVGNLENERNSLREQLLGIQSNPSYRILKWLQEAKGRLCGNRFKDE